MLLFNYYFIEFIIIIARESELRNLRKAVTDQEQEIFVLDKHNENMNTSVIKLESYTEQLKLEEIKHEQYLRKLRLIFYDALAKASLSGKYFFKLVNS